MKDPLLARLLAQLKAQRLPKSVLMVEVHDYEFQKRRFGKPLIDTDSLT